MRPLKIGDVVTIKSWKEIKLSSTWSTEHEAMCDEGESFVEDMKRFCGRELIIEGVSKTMGGWPVYYLGDDEASWAFCEWMFKEDSLGLIIDRMRNEIETQSRR